ncbi:MAG: hypothetical protein IPK97_06840 [Ahniella sp.]|nr:hypothetical protein [Ahniella sp.]
MNLVLDSDMLFHQNPDELLSYLDSPQVALVMKDCKESYGYPRQALEQLTGQTLPQAINVGALCLTAAQLTGTK